MKILYFVAGSGDASYCENCLRDGDLLDALVGLGHDVIAMPLYLPPLLETDRVPLGPLFYGGINVYLRERFASYRRWPGWVRSLMDRPGLLKAAGRRAGTTDPATLAATAQSMLAGEAGRQSDELERVASWLTDSGFVPDVVVLSNALLGGLAARLAALYGAPVASLLQDEHEFLDVIPEPHAEPLWTQLREALSAVSLVIPVSRYYQNSLAHKLGFGEERSPVIYPGVKTALFPVAPDLPGPPGLGFLSRWSQDKAPHLLAEAFLALREQPDLATLQLHFAGGFQTTDRAYIDSWRSKLAALEANGDVTFTPAFDQASRLKLFSRIRVLVVTEEEPPAYRRFVMEALSTGKVVLAPSRGCFPELKGLVSGGLILYSSPAELTERLAALLRSGEDLKAVGAAASREVARRFDVKRSATALVEVLQSWLDKERT